MRLTCLYAAALALNLLVAVPAFGLERDACLERLKPVDERIASGRYPDRSVQMASDMRKSILQGCSYLDKATLDQMMTAFDTMLPADVVAAQRMDRAIEEAEEHARQASKAREASNTEPIRQQSVADHAVSEVLKNPPTAIKAFAAFVSRDEPMDKVHVLDWDVHDGNFRALYRSGPSRQQLRHPNAKHHYYVVVSGARRIASQHLIAETPVEIIPAAVLRSGYAEVVMQWAPREPGGDSRMERRSSVDGRVLSSGSAPGLPWSGRHRDSGDLVRMSTGDGNVLFTGHTVPAKDRGQFHWIKTSPVGEIIYQGVRMADVGAVTSNEWFRSANGNPGFVTSVTNFAVEGIQSDLDTPLIERVEGHELTGNVVAETRLLTLNGDATVAWESMALQRQFVWQGMTELGQSSAAALPAASAKTMAAESRYGGKQAPETLVSGNARRVAIAPIGSGLGVLLDINTPMGGDKSEDGRWLYEYQRDGEVRKSYLRPDARYLKTHFKMLTSSQRDAVYVLGAMVSGNGPYLVALDGTRRATAWGTASMQAGTSPKAMLADASGVWLLGQGQVEGSRQGLWIERIEFDE